MKYVELLLASLEPVVDYMSTTDPCDVVGNDIKMAQPYRAPLSGDRGVRMRLDYEISIPALDAIPDVENARKHVARLMQHQIANDLSDMLENGDTSSNDPLYKAMDGSLKRKQEPMQIDFDYVQVFRDRREKKNAYEYTVFLTVYVDWSK